MHTPAPLLLTPRDHHALEHLVRTGADQDDALARALARKLSQVRIVSPDTMPADIVTLDTRLAFEIDGLHVHERTLVLPQDYVPDGRCISVAALRGLALLGLKAGQSAAVSHGGRIERLRLMDVLYQPEAERHIPQPACGRAANDG
ncbi:hypothetical protein AEAC466_13245 [Asticcacaulis sp. AC466]|uniref:hypothetical protein n=1 Tax=Asticcacaulis sp. AC466 TaxID=1282362 RepID=UPI0003C3B864|nr:hypothetical protein [Asticcacaulis sp. AC466]ESQ83211.1 hypothetical protein AEAC466_13245 [Asticcacaulis sp. AC466]